MMFFSVSNAWLARGLARWLRFWLPLQPLTGMAALLRVVIAGCLLYSIFLYTFDFSTALQAMASRATHPYTTTNVGATMPFGLHWGFALEHLWQHPRGMRILHTVSIVNATALLLGVAVRLSAPLALLSYLLYVDATYAMATGYDGLLVNALLYLNFLPCGQQLSLHRLFVGHPGALRMRHANPPQKPDHPPRNPFYFPWGGIGLRLIQLHVCLLHVSSGLSRWHGDWFSQALLWRPLLNQAIQPSVLQALQVSPMFSTFLVYGMCLFELFFGVLVWLKGWRYWMLGLGVVLHVSFGLLFGPLAFNLLLVGLMLTFLPASWLQQFVRIIEDALSQVLPYPYRRR